MLDIFIAAHISGVGILKIVYMAVRFGMRRLCDAARYGSPLCKLPGAQ